MTLHAWAAVAIVVAGTLWTGICVWRLLECLREWRTEK